MAIIVDVVGGASDTPTAKRGGVSNMAGGESSTLYKKGFDAEQNDGNGKQNEGEK